MELCVKLAAFLDIFVEGQVDDLPLFGQEELPQLDLELPDVPVELDQGRENPLPLLLLDQVELFEDDVDVVGALDGLVEARVEVVGVFLEHVDVGHEGLLLELVLVDHED